MQVYLITGVLFLIIDLCWILLVARSMYIDAIPSLLTTNTSWLPVVAFYLLYPAGLKFLAIDHAPTAKTAALRGGVLGLTAYGTYCLTAQALFTEWTWTLTLADCAWGTVLSGSVALIVSLYQQRKK